MGVSFPISTDRFARRFVTRRNEESVENESEDRLMVVCGLGRVNEFRNDWSAGAVPLQ
jgi:hypothetical protein